MAYDPDRDLKLERSALQRAIAGLRKPQPEPSLTLVLGPPDPECRVASGDSVLIMRNGVVSEARPIISQRRS